MQLPQPPIALLRLTDPVALMQDEPGGTGLCADNTDVADCAICSWTNDGWCDEPGGTGLCSAGTDTADCDTCLWRGDGDCDEITGLCPAGSDSADCASYRSSCFWTNDGECVSDKVAFQASRFEDKAHKPRVV